MPEGVGYGPQFTASTGLTLNYIGNHVYAHSGETSTPGSQAYVDLLNFTTGATSYIVGEISMFGPVDATDPSSGNASNFRVSFNGVVIFFVNIDSAQEDHPAQAVVPFLIPPNTTVLVEANSSASAWNPSVTLAGRVYGKVDE